MAPGSGYRQINAKHHAKYIRYSPTQWRILSIEAGRIVTQIRGCLTPSGRSYKNPTRYCGTAESCQNPFGPPLNVFVEHYADIVYHEPADEEPEELGRVLNAELKPKMRLRRMLQPWIFHLSGNLICTHLSVNNMLEP